MVSIYLRSFFSGALCKTILFLQEGRFSRSSSSKVINVGAIKSALLQMSWCTQSQNFCPSQIFSYVPQPMQILWTWANERRIASGAATVCMVTVTLYLLTMVIY